MISIYSNLCLLLMMALALAESPTGSRQVNLPGNTSNKYVYPSYPYGIGSSTYNPGPFGGLDYGGYPGAGFGAYPGLYPGGFGGYPSLLGYGGYPGLGYGGLPGIGYGGLPGIGYGGLPGIGYGGYPSIGYGGINSGYPFLNPFFRHP